MMRGSEMCIVSLSQRSMMVCFCCNMAKSLSMAVCDGEMGSKSSVLTAAMSGAVASIFVSRHGSLWDCLHLCFVRCCTSPWW